MGVLIFPQKKAACPNMAITKKERKINQNPSPETPTVLIRPRRIATEKVSYAENSPNIRDTQSSPMTVSERPKRRASSNKSYKEPLLTKKLRQNKRDIK